MNFINLQKAVVEIRQACAGVKDNQRTPFFFIVGAGISYPSIPIASELVKQLKDSARAYGHQDEPPGKEPVDAYAHWFQAAYPQRIDRQGFLRSLIEKKPITHANLRLAHLLLERTVTNLVVTPNFDDFLTRALQLFGKYHVICDHPRTVERIDHEQGDVQIVHVHGTYSFYDCCNLRGEIEGQAKPSEEYSMGFLVDQAMYRRSPLVVGYSGWDGDVITTAIRKRLIQGRLPRKIYWFCYKRTDADKLPQWLRDRGRKPDDDVCFVVPEEEAGRGEPAGTRSALTVASRPIDAGRGERGLDAKDVFAALIEAFQLKAPSLTSDPLRFFAGHLRGRYRTPAIKE